MKNEVWGLKTPNWPLSEICALLTPLMRWSDLNVFGIDSESVAAV